MVFLASPVIYLMMIVSFIRGLWTRHLSYLESFSFLYASLMIFWSGFTMTPDGFTRFVLPLLPFIFWGGLRFVGMMKNFKIDLLGAARVAFLVLLLINATNLFFNRDFDDDVFNSPVNSEMINWLKSNMKPNEHFMFWKPRAVGLLIGREGTAPWIVPGQDQHFLQRVKDFRITYIVALTSNDLHLNSILDNNVQFKPVWHNAGYRVFKLLQ